jgi:hypothetical protein
MIRVFIASGDGKTIIIPNGIKIERFVLQKGIINKIFYTLIKNLQN